jgi:hypothetical protein
VLALKPLLNGEIEILLDNTQQARQNSIDSQIRPWGGLNYIANNALRDIPTNNHHIKKII